MPLPKQHEVDVWNRALSRVGDSKIVLEADVALTSVSAANPPLVTAAGHGYVTGDHVLLYDMTGGTQVNGRVFLVTVLSSSTFQLRREDGSTNAAATGGLGARLPATKIVKTCFDAWPVVRDEILRAHPWNSIVRRTRLARLQAAKTITAVTAANPPVVSVAAHGYTAGDTVLIDGIVGMVELNERYFTVGTTTAGTFELVGEDATAYAAYVSAGTSRKALQPLQPDFGYGYRYTLPDDCERVLELVDQPEILWELEGRELQTDAGITVPIRYCRKITDPELYDAQLTNVLTARLADEIAIELSASKSQKQNAHEEWIDALSEAKRTDSQEQSPQQLAEDSWVLAHSMGAADPMPKATPRGTR